MSRTSFLTGALLALVLGGLVLFGVLGERLGREARASAADVARPGAAGPAGPDDGAVHPAATLRADGEPSSAPVAAAPRERGGPERGGRVGLLPEPDARPGVAVVPARLRGELRGPAGPVRGAHVRLVLDGTSIDDAQSDEGGGFQLRTGQLAGGLQLQVHARGFAPHEVDVRQLIPGESRNLGTLLLRAGRVLDVDVTDARGRPVPGAEVIVEAAGAGRGNAFRHASTTGPQGRARFPDAPLGEVRVLARAEDNGMRVVTHEHDGSGRPLRLALLPENGFTLLLRTADARPVPGATVHLLAAEGRQEIHEGTSDEEGRVVFRGLGAERFDARILAPGYRTDSRRGLVADGREVVHELLPWPCAELVVRTPGGQPLPEGTVARALPNTLRSALLRPSGAYEEPGVPVAADGSARLCDLRPGEYVVRIDAPGYAPTLSQAVRVTLEQDASLGTLTLHTGGRLVVRVRSETTDEPLADATVELHADRPTPAALVNETPAFAAAVLAQTRADAAGLAVFERVTPGDYLVLVRAGGHQARLSTHAHVTDDATAELGPLELSPGRSITGRVRTPGGTPVRNAMVVLRGVRADAPVQLSTDAQGRFASPPLAPGPWDVSAHGLGPHAEAEPAERRVLLGLNGEEPEALDLVLGG